MKINYANVAQMMKAASGYKDTPKVEKSIYDSLVKGDNAPVVFMDGNRQKPQLSPEAYLQAKQEAEEGNALAEQVLRIAKAIRGNASPAQEESDNIAKLAIDTIETANGTEPKLTVDESQLQKLFEFQAKKCFGKIPEKEFDFFHPAYPQEKAVLTELGFVQPQRRYFEGNDRKDCFVIYHCPETHLSLAVGWVEEPGHNHKPYNVGYFTLSKEGKLLAETRTRVTPAY